MAIGKRTANRVNIAPVTPLLSNCLPAPPLILNQPPILIANLGAVHPRPAVAEFRIALTQRRDQATVARLA